MGGSTPQGSERGRKAVVCSRSWVYPEPWEWWAVIMPSAQSLATPLEKSWPASAQTPSPTPPQTDLADRELACGHMETGL